jgi:hypothetical protein
MPPTLDYFPGPPPPRHDNWLQWAYLIPGAAMMAFGVLASIVFHRADQYVVDPGGGMCMFAMGFILTAFVLGVLLISRSASDRQTIAQDEDEDAAPEGFSRR